mmetsp:Transcript_32058/g.69393  ORF Transcript_32058/g.69393 Transcript_32058/m.69393 type:complete len:1099 (+) Transcript_32058:401-3697(+)
MTTTMAAAAAESDQGRDAEEPNTADAEEMVVDSPEIEMASASPAAAAAAAPNESSASAPPAAAAAAASYPHGGTTTAQTPVATTTATASTAAMLLSTATQMMRLTSPNDYAMATRIHAILADGAGDNDDDAAAVAAATGTGKDSGSTSTTGVELLAPGAALLTCLVLAVGREELVADGSKDVETMDEETRKRRAREAAGYTLVDPPSPRPNDDGAAAAASRGRDDDDDEEEEEGEEGEERGDDDQVGKSGGASATHEQKLEPTPANVATQRQSWEDLRKLINGTINRLNATTIKPLIHKLFTEGNLIRGRGLLARTVLRAATTSPSYADVYSALIAVINTKLPEVGELVLSRTILQFQRSYKRRDKAQAVATANFLGQLFNQGMTHELLCLQLLTVLLDGDPTDDSVEVAVSFMRTVGKALAEVSPAGVRAVMERFRGLLHDGTIGKRVQYKVEGLIKDRRSNFENYPTIVPELDLVESDDQIMFEIGLDDDDLKKEEVLDVFRFDPDFEENERTWAKIRGEILGEDSEDSDGSSGSGDSDTDSGSGSDEESDGEEDQQLVPPPTNGDKKKTQVIHDLTESDLVHLRRTIYLTIMSSATFEECTHKLTKVDIPLGRESELINMIIECCSQERTFLRYYGMIAGRFCLLHPRWRDAFLEAFGVQYETIHRLETNKLRNVAKLFAHLLHTDSMPWSCLSGIHLNEDETTSSSRIFVKILVQEMAEAMGMSALRDRFETDEPEQSQWYAGMFPRDVPRNTCYAINFFTSIGLGPLTDGLREHLKNAPKLILAQAQAEAAAKAAAAAEKAADDSSVSSSSSSSTSTGSSTSYSSSSYTSSSSSSHSSDSRSRGRRSGRDRGRSRSSRKRRGRPQRRRSRSYSSSSYSSSGSRSRYTSSSVSSRGKKRGSARRRPPSRSLSRSRSRSLSRSRSTSKRKGGGGSGDGAKRAASESRSPSRSRSRSRRSGDGGSRVQERKPSRSRSYTPRKQSRSLSPPRESKGRDRERSYSRSASRSRSRSRSRSPQRREREGRRSHSRSFSSSRSRSPSERRRNMKRGRRDRRRSRSSSSRSDSRDAKRKRYSRSSHDSRSPPRRRYSRSRSS